MSHEIRTPMNAVIGMSGLLLDTPLDSDQREYAETIRTSSDALLAIINDILDFSKIEAGRLELETSSFELRDCVETALDLVSTRAQEKHLELTYRFEDNVPLSITSDITRLRQVLINLLSNAVKFTERGAVTLTVGLIEQKAQSVVLRFSIHDTGIGLSADSIERLFQPFVQADSSTTRKYGGTGLGLAISKRLVGLMGGEMSVTSDGLGRGATFSFTIDVPVDSAFDVKPRDIVPDQPVNERELAAQLPLTILLAEDNVVNQKLALRLLSQMGYDATVAANGVEVVRALEYQAYDVILMDVQMPEMDGLEATRLIRSEFPTDQQPRIIAMTANAMQGDREMCLAAGMDDYIAKPIRVADLAGALRRSRTIGR